MRTSQVLLAAMLSCASCIALSDAPPLRTHTAGGPTAYSHPTPTVSFASSAGAAIVIVVDPGHASSYQLLDTLRTTGLDGRRIAVVVLSNAISAPMYLRDHRAMLPSAQWTLASSVDVRKDIPLPGTPVVLGLDVDRRVIWQVEGVSPQRGDLSVRIADWLAAAK